MAIANKGSYRMLAMCSQLQTIIFFLAVGQSCARCCGGGWNSC